LRYLPDGSLCTTSVEQIFPRDSVQRNCFEFALYHDCISNRIGSGIRNYPRRRCRPRYVRCAPNAVGARSRDHRAERSSVLGKLLALHRQATRSHRPSMAMPPAAAPYCASGLVIWRITDLPACLTLGPLLAHKLILDDGRLLDLWVGVLARSIEGRCCQSRYGRGSLRWPRPEAAYCMRTMRKLPVVPVCRSVWPCPVGQITTMLSPVSCPQEGRLAIVTDVGHGMRWPHIAGRNLLRDERRVCGRRSRVVLALRCRR
jgi:hypothetical protein